MQAFFESLLYNSNNPLLFNSVLFFMLFSVLYTLYVLVFNKILLRNILLLVFSLFFYYKIGGPYVILLVLIASIDFFLGKAIFKSKKIITKKFFVAISLIVNVGSLSYFKYTDFFLKIWYDAFHFTAEPLELGIIKPIGISFFVFKTLTYIFDIYRDMIEKPEKNYLNYILYVSFFPNILAGPISKARDLLPQIRSKLTITDVNIGKGFFLILTGAFKKFVIADYIAANFVERIFDSPQFFSGFETLMACYGYTIHIYCDFSGYTDMVIGLAFLLGFHIKPNFNKPFLAQNVSDFWRRWHITLSTWLNEYIFYPMSFSMRRFKKIGAISAVIITFTISGLWHGPEWTFVLWGVLHGIAIAYDVFSQNYRDKVKKFVPRGIYRFISIFITLHFLAFSMILFKADNLEVAGIMYSKIFYTFDIQHAEQWVISYMTPFLIMLLGYVLHFLPQKWNDITCEKYIKLFWPFKAIIAAVMIIIIYQAYSTESLPFIYLEF